MRSTLLVLALAIPTVANAQPTDPGSGTTDVTPTPPPTPPPTPTPTPTPPPQPHPVEHVDSNGVRPSDLAFAIGIGYVRPPGGSIDLQTPNLASVRLRLISGLTFEPTVSISNTSTDMDTPAMQMTDTLTVFDLGTLVRLPVIQHGRVDFEVLGALDFGVTKDNPDGDYNTKTTTTFDLGWGIGIGYWLSHHWQLSASATNPLVSYSQVKQQTSATTETKTASTTYGVTFEPTIFAMIHLYN